MLEVGMKAPAFTLPDKDGNLVSLSDFAGKRVVLYFYPRDNTPGCTRQACAFAGAYEEFKKIGAVVIGVSKDSAASHQRFAEKYDLPFVLLSDPELTGQEQSAVALEIFYPDIEAMPPEDYQEALDRLLWFLNGGDTPEDRKMPKLVDWEQDFTYIVAPINRVTG